MAFIDFQESVPVEDIRLKMEAPVVADLKRYAEFRKCTPQRAAQEILRKAMRIDKEFQALLNPQAQPASVKKSKPKPQAIDGKVA